MQSVSHSDNELKSPELVPSLPPSWYVTEVQFQREKEKIFTLDWIFLCHAQEVAQPGDYITSDVMGIPVIVLRDEQNEIQILLNVCRHRAAPLLTEKKGKLSKPHLMCQYHGWCYHMDGRFKQAPFISSDCESLSLKKIAFREAHGMIFITFNPDPYPFADRQQELLQEFQSANFNMAAYHYDRQLRWEGNFNWKAWVEGYQECYHCPTIHPIFNRDFQLGKYQVKNKNYYSVHQCPRKEKSDSGSFEGLWLWLYPNCGLPCYENVYYTMRINPKSPAKTELICTFFVNEKCREGADEKFFEFVASIIQEDIAICEKVQQNLQHATGEHLLNHGYLNAARENGVHYFHQLVRRAVDVSTINVETLDNVV